MPASCLRGLVKIKESIWSPDSRIHSLIKRLSLDARSRGLGRAGQPCVSVRAPFGVYAHVVEPGAIAVGDRVILR